MKIQSKILLLKTRDSVRQACAGLLADEVLYWRPMVSAEAIDAALESQEFQLVVFDHRFSNADGIAEVESIRKLQSGAKVLLISDALELQDVVRAMRTGVREVFLPPFDPDALIKCVKNTLTESYKVYADAADWSVATEFFDATSNGSDDSAAGQATASTQNPDTHPRPDEQSESYAKVRSQLADATAECKRLGQDVARLSAVEDHALSLQQELEQAREALAKRQPTTEGARANGKPKEDARVPQLEADLAAEKRKTATLEKALEEAAGFKSSTEAKNAGIESARAEAEKKLGELQAERAAAQARVTTLETENAHLSKSFEKERQRLETEISRLQEIEKSKTDETRKGKGEHERLTREVEALGEQLARLRPVEQDLESARLELNALQKEKSAFADRDAARALIEKQLSAERERSKEIEARARATSAEAAKAVADAEARIETEHTALNKARGELDERKQAFEQSRNEHETERKRHEDNFSRRELALAAKEKGHQEAVAQLDQKRKQLQTDVDAHEASVATLQELEAALSDDRKQFENHVAETEAERAAVEERAEAIAKREGELHDLDQKLQDASASLNAEREKLDTAHAELKKAQARQDEKINAQTSDLQSREKALAEATATLEAERAKLISETEAHAAEKDALEKQRSQAEEARSKLETRAAELDELEKRLAQREEQNKDTESKLEAAKNLIERTRASVDNAREEVEADRKQLTERIAQFEKKRDALAEQMKSLLANC